MVSRHKTWATAVGKRPHDDDTDEPWEASTNYVNELDDYIDHCRFSDRLAAKFSKLSDAQKVEVLAGASKNLLEFLERGGIDINGRLRK